MNKVMFFHPSIHDIESMLNYFRITDLNVRNNICWDEDDPDIVFVTDGIYKVPDYICDWSIYFEKFTKLYHSGDRIFILFSEEAVYPDFNIFDYAIVWSAYLSEFNRVVKLPEQYFYFHEKHPFENKYDFNCAIIDASKKDFCSFIYSNPHAHPKRDKFFFALNKYKKVSSLGIHLNNIQTTFGRSNKSWLKESIVLKNRYKFSITFENASYYGYTTEKLLSSFKAHTIPIYWGNPKVSDYYNPEAFINCHEYNGFEEVIDKIREIDENDEMWAEMVSQPWQTEEQKIKTKEMTNDYISFLSEILTADDLQGYHQRPCGTWTNMYYGWFFRAYGKNDL